jgi:hypothetical protein
MFFLALLPGMFVVMRLRQGKRIGDGSSISPQRRPCESRDPYAEDSQVEMEPTPRRNNNRRWLWVPAFAGTTRGEGATHGELPPLLAGGSRWGQADWGWFVNITPMSSLRKQGPIRRGFSSGERSQRHGATITAGGYGSLRSQGRLVGKVPRTVNSLSRLRASDSCIPPPCGEGRPSEAEAGVGGSARKCANNHFADGAPHPTGLRPATLPTRGIITLTQQSRSPICADAPADLGAGAPDPELVAVVEAEVKAWIAEPWLDAESRGFETLTRRLLAALERAEAIYRHR